MENPYAQIERAAAKIADAITARAAGASDASGGHVESLTEAVMGMTRGLCSIANAIESLAEAVGRLEKDE